MNDEKIISAIRAGDEQAIAWVMQKYSRLLWSVVTAVLAGSASVQDAEECVADVFVYLWQHPEKYDARKGRLKSWLSMVARSKAIDRYRAVIRYQEVSLEENLTAGNANTENQAGEDWFMSNGLVEKLVSGDADVLPRLVEQEEREQLLCCLQQLEEADRDILIRRYFYEQKPKEIALALDLPKKQVENRLYQSKLRLKKMMEV